MIPLRIRFWDKVRLAAGADCWMWCGSTDAVRYGQIRTGGRGSPTVSAHRVAFELAHGPIPDGMFVCHRCDTPGCVRPDHLFLGTASDNNADMVAKGRHVHGESAKRWQRAHGERASGAKLSVRDVAAIRAGHAAGRTYRNLAAEFGVSFGSVAAIVTGRTWRHN